MNRKQKAIAWWLSSAVAAAPLVMGATALAQYRVQNNDGHALDANSRLGSGGYNSASDIRAPVPGNDIVTGNVTGLRYFHGNIDYTDPKAFRGNAPGLENSDALLRTAGDEPTPDNTAPQFQPEGRIFLGGSRAVAPPPNFQPIAPGSPGYIPSHQIKPRSVGDARLGDISHGSVVDTPETSQLILQGPPDQQGQPSIITASPLFGIRPAMPQDQSLLPSDNTRDLLGLDDATLQRMRQELGTSAPNAGSTKTGITGAPIPGANILSLNAPLNSEAPNSAVQDQSIAGQALNGEAGQPNSQGVHQQFIIPPEEQNSTYARMLKKYQQMEAQQKMTPAQRAAAYNAVMQQRAHDQAAARSGAAQPGILQPGGTQPGVAQPGTGAVPGAMIPSPETPGQKTPSAKSAGRPPKSTTRDASQPKPAASNPQSKAPSFVPIEVNSVAEGMTGKGLADLSKQAEDLVRRGKYSVALEKYDAAEAVAPNNPMVKMGRAIAELGDGSFARADLHLRDAYARNPALTVAKFNLENQLGRERVQSLVHDLRDLAVKQKKDPRPVFLLAFIAYNTGSPETASAYLDLAQKRAGNADPLLKSLQEHWSHSEKAPQLNK